MLIYSVVGEHNRALLLWHEDQAYFELITYINAVSLRRVCLVGPDEDSDDILYALIGLMDTLI